MKITLTNIIEIEQPTEDILNYCKKELVFKNPDYDKKKRMGFSIYKTPKTISLYDLYNNNIYLSIGCFEDIWKIHPVKEDYVDYTTTKRADIKSNIKLRDYQEPCIKALKKYVNGIFVLFAGAGKTQIALQCASELKQKTLFMTHTKDLLNQAKERCKNNLICTTSEISEGKCDVSGDMVFATVQTLVSIIDKGEIKQDEFGLIIVDECFPKGTKINTPKGYINIEDLKLGDHVYSYNHKNNKIEIKEIDELFEKDTDNMITLSLSNGKTIICTENHPIYTSTGYKQAKDIKEGEIVYEMYFLWERNDPRRIYKNSMVLQEKEIQNTRKNILFKRMCKKFCNSKFKQLYEVGSWTRKNDKKQSNVKTRNKTKSFGFLKENKSQTENKRWKWNWFDKSTRNTFNRTEKTLYKCDTRISNKNRNEKWKWLSNLLQSRYSDSRENDRDRSRWTFTSFINKTRARRKENTFLRELRVENIEISKRRSVGKFTKRDENIKVYNIGVKDNNNYFVNDILVHNCHHLTSNAESVKMFEKCLNYFNARYKLGMTATLHMANGLEKTTTKLIGNVIYELKKNDTKDKFIGYYEGKPIVEVPASMFQVPAEINVVHTNYDISDKDVYDVNGGTLVFTKLITDLSMDKDRNKLILDILNKLNGYTIIISERVDQLHYLSDRISSSVCIDGKTPKKQREKMVEEFRNGKHKVLLASYSLVAEGFDVPMLENLIMASPVKDERLVIQSVGRCQRPYENKKIANVYDLVDNVSMLERFFTKRKSTYKKEGWKLK